MKRTTGLQRLLRPAIQLWMGPKMKILINALRFQRQKQRNGENGRRWRSAGQANCRQQKQVGKCFVSVWLPELLDDLISDESENIFSVCFTGGQRFRPIKSTRFVCGRKSGSWKWPGVRVAHGHLHRFPISWLPNGRLAKIWMNYGTNCNQKRRLLFLFGWHLKSVGSPRPFNPATQSTFLFFFIDSSRPPLLSLN